MPAIARLIVSDFDELGFAVVPGVVPLEEVDTLGTAIGAAGERLAILRRDGALYGMRDALRSLPEVRSLARSEPLLGLIRPVLGPGVFPVRALLFDKTPGANWGVPWHQDLTIAVKNRVDAPGFGPWTVKAGVTHVRPPIDVLERMVTLRIHLDDCGTIKARSASWWGRTGTAGSGRRPPGSGSNADRRCRASQAGATW